MATAAQAPYGYAKRASAYNKPDPELAKYQLQVIQGLYRKLGPTEFSKRALWILRKNPEEGETDILPTNNRYWNRRLVPFVHNRIQTDLDNKIIVANSLRNIMLKPRQAGYTTWSILMRLLLPAIMSPGTGSMLMSQTAEYAAAHFDMLKRAWRYFMVTDPFTGVGNEWADSLRKNLLHISYSNRRELIFDTIDSRVRCASAEVEEAGQGLTLQHLVCTEVSRWEGKPEETLANAKEAVPKEGTLDIECTPNGMGGYFYEEWKRATNPGNTKREFKPHFHTWWWHDEYRRKPGIAMSQLEEDEKALVVTFGVDGEQIAWRREKKESLRHNFEEKYPEDEITCFLAAGQLFFERDILNQRFNELTAYKPFVTKGDKIVIFKKPIKNRRYILGVDVATGLPITSDNPDWSAAVVIDEETGEEMAAYRAHELPETLAWDMDQLGRMYNEALMAVERNGEGGTVILALRTACQYGNMYMHRDWWKRNWQTRIKEIEGFPTTLKTRPLALNRIRWFVAESPHLIHDRVFLGEAMSFIRDEDKGIPKAQTGAHDDTVMCRAIAHYVRAVRNGYLDPSQIQVKEKYGATPREFAGEEEIDKVPDEE